MALRRIVVILLTTVCAAVLLGNLSVLAQATDEPPEPDCQSCTARHQSLKRLQETLSDAPKAIDGLPGALERAPPPPEDPASAQNDLKSRVTDD